MKQSNMTLIVTDNVTALRSFYTSDYLPHTSNNHVWPISYREFFNSEHNSKKMHIIEYLVEIDDKDHYNNRKYIQTMISNVLKKIADSAMDKMEIEERGIVTEEYILYKDNTSSWIQLHRHIAKIWNEQCTFTYNYQTLHLIVPPSIYDNANNTQPPDNRKSFIPRFYDSRRENGIIYLTNRSIPLPFELKPINSIYLSDTERLDRFLIKYNTPRIQSHVDEIIKIPTTIV